MMNYEACLKAGLTARELISLVAKGMSNKEIASELKLSEGTVKSYMFRIMKQLGAESRQEAVDLIRAVRAGQGSQSFSQTCVDHLTVGEEEEGGPKRHGQSGRRRRKS